MTSSLSSQEGLWENHSKELDIFNLVGLHCYLLVVTLAAYGNSGGFFFLSTSEEGGTNQ